MLRHLERGPRVIPGTRAQEHRDIRARNPRIYIHKNIHRVWDRVVGRPPKALPRTPSGATGTSRAIGPSGPTSAAGSTNIGPLELALGPGIYGPWQATIVARDTGSLAPTLCRAEGTRASGSTNGKKPSGMATPLPARNGNPPPRMPSHQNPAARAKTRTSRRRARTMAPSRPTRT